MSKIAGHQGQMSNKELVLAKYPEAISHQWLNGWMIYSKPTGGNIALSGIFKSAKIAWADAAIGCER